MTFLANLNWLPTQALMKRIGSAKALFDTDFGSGSVAGFSLRTLSKDMVGQPVVKVRRSVDDVEQDIGLTKDGLDETALLDFVNNSSSPGSLNDLTLGFSLRNLSEDYNGAVVRVRRSFDDLEQDFTASEVSDGTLITFTGSGDGFVTAWYNQGSGDDAVQNDAAAQPKIVSNGSFILENGSPIIDFDGVDDYFSFSGAAYSSFASVFVVATQITGNDYQRFLNIHNGSSNLQLTDNTKDLLTKDTRFQGGTDSSIWVSGVSGSNLISAFFGSSGISLFFNSDEETSGPGTAIGGGLDNLSTIGVRSDLLSSTFSSFNVGEILVYSSDMSSDRIIIEANLNDYYNVYVGDNTINGDGFVTTWYDQSGNNNHATQTTAANQPKIVSDGVIETDSSKPVIKFDGVDDFLIYVGMPFANNQPFSIFSYARINADEGTIFDSADKPNFSSSSGLRFDFVSNDYRIGSKSSFTEVSYTFNVSPFLHSAIINSSNRKLFLSGNEIASSIGDFRPDFTNVTQFKIGALTPEQNQLDGMNFLDGYIGDLIVYNSDKGSVRTEIEGDLFNHYFEKPGAFTSGDWSIVITSSTESEVEITNYPSDGGLNASVEYRVNGGAVQTASITADKFTVTASVDDIVEIRQVNLVGSGAWSDVKTPSYDVDYQAVLDYGTNQGYTLPSVSQRGQQNKLMLDMKSSGAWNKLDTFSVMATDGSSDFALIDWKRLTTMTAVNSPTFTVNQGFTGDGASAHINTGYNLSTDSINYTFTDACIGGYFNDVSGEVGVAVMGGIDSSNNSSHIANFTGTERALINAFNSSTPNMDIGFANGNFMAFTNTSVDIGLLNNDNTVTNNDQRTAIPNAPFGYLGRTNDTGGVYANSTVTVAVGYAGADLSGVKTPFFNALNTYMGGL